MLRSTVAGPHAPFHLGYRPALDGICGLAVMVHHFLLPLEGATSDDLDFGRGGVLGVNVFFVLSGFLITTLLGEE